MCKAGVSRDLREGLAGLALEVSPSCGAQPLCSVPQEAHLHRAFCRFGEKLGGFQGRLKLHSTAWAVMGFHLPPFSPDPSPLLTLLSCPLFSCLSPPGSSPLPLLSNESLLSVRREFRAHTCFLSKPLASYTRLETAYLSRSVSTVPGAPESPSCEYRISPSHYYN